MCSHSPCLNNIAASHRIKKCFSVSFLFPEEELEKSAQNGSGCHLQLGIKIKLRLGLRNRRL
jgi:hypothetical protein